MAKPCTPHLIPQAAQLFKIETANVGGRGELPSRSLGGSRGPFSHVREWPPWCCGAHAAFSLRALRGKQPLPEGAQKRSSPFGLLLFYFSQMTGFWRSDSTKAGAHVLAGHDARGDLVLAEEVDVGHLKLVGVVHLGLELLLFRIDLRADACGAKVGGE